MNKIDNSSVSQAKRRGSEYKSEDSRELKLPQRRVQTAPHRPLHAANAAGSAAHLTDRKKERKLTYKYKLTPPPKIKFNNALKECYNTEKDGSCECKLIDDIHFVNKGNEMQAFRPTWKRCLTERNTHSLKKNFSEQKIK